jgi:glycosyltransferase involved in cell wall biosynthesis
VNTNLPLVSVIIPCFNVEKYVEKAITSIVNQTYKNLEIWIIDDASTDDTLQKINLFSDQRIKVISFEENTQKVGAVNEILQRVNGDYIAFQDADDWSEPDRVKMQLQEFRNDPELGICFTGYRYISNKVSLPSKISLTNNQLKSEFLDFFKNDINRDSTVSPTLMISKEALLKTKGYSYYFAGRVAEDIQWIYRILKDFKGITIDKILYNYRLREGSFTHIQSTGTNAKYAYSWQLLSKIIHKDIHEGIDVLAPENKELINKLELEACEEALVKTIQLLNETRLVYENSSRYRLGKFLLKPFHSLNNLVRAMGKKIFGEVLSKN